MCDFLMDTEKKILLYPNTVRYTETVINSEITVKKTSNVIRK